MYFKDLIRFRQCWLGVALIWIMLYHVPLDFGLLNPFISLGYGGVDICLFASGIGCFYSLSSESNILCFMKRRLKRLVPTYIVFIIAWLVYQYFAGNFELQMALGNLLAIQNFTGHGNDFNWYISAIFLFYILAPYFKLIIEKENYVYKFLFLLFLFICSIPFWHAEKYIITITRLPIFYIGMIFAYMCKKNKKISNKYVLGMIISFILGFISIVVFFTFLPQYLWSCGLYWYPFVLITPPLCVAISYIAMILERTKVTKLLISFYSLCGNYSFELYLVHILLISCISSIIKMADFAKISYLIWIIGAVLCFVGCFILRCITRWIWRLFVKK